MQYLLTEPEYLELQRKINARVADNDGKLLALCMQAAIHVPISRDWEPGAPARPWGCILDTKSNPTYCDECPARKVCPHDDKEWSK